MAQSLGVDSAELSTLIRDSFDDRTRGRLGDLHQTVKWLAASLGATPSEAGVHAAVHLRLEMTYSLHRRTWAIPALVALGRAGVPRGLVSDCSAETPEIWSRSPLSPHFEAVSFSCVTTHRKPHPDAYLVALRTLGVEPQDCLYVGDGGSHELTGAMDLGMSAIRFEPPSDGKGEGIDAETGWSRQVPTDLAEVVRYVI